MSQKRRTAAGFEFRAVRTNENWKPLTGANAASSSIYSDAEGNARFTSVYTQAGIYHFLLTEVDQNAPGWTYSSAQYHVTVTVTEDGGVLSASASRPNESTLFENTYTANAAQVTWTLEVAPGAEVTVSFRVKVSASIGTTVRNKAEVLEGKNRYSTNEVTNSVTAPETPLTPQTGDTPHIQLWFALLFVSGGGLVTASIYGRKRKEAELENT